MATPQQQLGSGDRVLSDVSNAMVQALKHYYGKGPTKAKSYLVDDYLIVAMRDPYTVVEHTLMRAGRHHLVREFRQTFQNEMAEELTTQVEKLLERRVLGYQSQVVFDPDTVFEIFILEPADGPEDPPPPGADGDGSPAFETTGELRAAAPRGGP
jgi:uncharacterized protein YbcI